MPTQKKMYQICPICKGLKEINASVNHNGDPPVFGPELEIIPCPNCQGVGYVEWGYMET